MSRLRSYSALCCVIVLLYIYLIATNLKQRANDLTGGEIGHEVARGPQWEQNPTVCISRSAAPRSPDPAKARAEMNPLTS